jgi:hypothetical protein
MEMAPQGVGIMDSAAGNGSSGTPRPRQKRRMSLGNPRKSQNPAPKSPKALFAPSRRDRRLPLLRLLHQVDEAAEEVVAVARAGRGIGAVLHREGRAVGEPDAAVRAVEQRDVRLPGVGRETFCDEGWRTTRPPEALISSSNDDK